ncbi:hypothetical protein [Xanthomonas bundabergensis]|uniref:hypothetical protein n=1 Tax=Xanthomonas bundabergensis TaxID=3160842 RepID=UPI003518F4AA
MDGYQFLDVPTLDRVIERAEILDAIGDTSHLEVYAVYPTHPAYEYIHFVQMSVEAMTRSLCALKGKEFLDDDYLGLSAHGFGVSWRVQMDDVIDLALQDTLPPIVYAPIDHRGKKGAHDAWARAFRPWLTYILRIGFIHLFETNERAVMKHGGDAGRLAKLVRDSSAHGGKVCTREGSVAFRGLEFDKSQNKRAELSDHFGFGDYLVLALCMLNAPKMGLPPFRPDSSVPAGS